MTYKKQFTTSIDVGISSSFKNSCDSRGLKMNTVLEAFMKQFSENEFKVIIKSDGIRLDIEEK